VVADFFRVRYGVPGTPPSREETMMSLLETSRHGSMTLLRMSRAA
jgi:hypothetical protein